MYSDDRRRYESALARAHKALWQAQAAAELGGDFEAHDAIDPLLTAVSMLHEASLKGKLKVLNGQLKLI